MFVPKDLANNIPALVPIMAWRWQSDKPLSEPKIHASLGLSEFMFDMIKLSCNVRHDMSLECNQRGRVFDQFLCPIWCDSICHWPGFIRQNSVNPFDALFSRGYISNDIYGHWKKQIYHETICSKFAIYAWYGMNEWWYACNTLSYKMYIFHITESYFIVSVTQNEGKLRWQLHYLISGHDLQMDIYVWLSAPPSYHIKCDIDFVETCFSINCN